MLVDPGLTLFEDKNECYISNFVLILMIPQNIYVGVFCTKMGWTGSIMKQIHKNNLLLLVRPRLPLLFKGIPYQKVISLFCVKCVLKKSKELV